MSDWISDSDFGIFIKRLKRKRRKIKIQRSIQTQDKRNGINNNQKKFRPDFVSVNSKARGKNKRIGRFDASDNFNEHDN